jgi:heme-degrading monooxygenase HmoA
MIIEHAILQVRAGQAAEFEAAMAQAKPLIAASPGFHDISVRPGIDTPDTYLLIVQWDDVASHREGFRGSERYQQWRSLLHKFYDPMPHVTYFGETI